LDSCIINTLIWENALKFFIDFGLVEEDRQTTRAFLRGNGTQPYVYLAEQSPDENRHFIGAYWNVCTAKDLEMATPYRTQQQ
jgi:hypothetical protein